MSIRLPALHFRCDTLIRPKNTNSAQPTEPQKPCLIPSRNGRFNEKCFCDLFRIFGFSRLRILKLRKTTPRCDTSQTDPTGVRHALLRCTCCKSVSEPPEFILVRAKQELRHRFTILNTYAFDVTCIHHRESQGKGWPLG